MSSKSNIFVTIVLLFIFILSAPALSKSRPAEKERLKFKNNKIAVMNEFLFFPKTNTQKKMAVQTFDINGNKLSVVELDNDEKQIKKVEYTYDADNNEISFVEYGASDKIRQKCVNKFDDKKENLIEELFYNAAGSLGYRRIAKIDRSNNISEQALYDKNNKFINRSAHKYDRNANKIETNVYNAANVFNGRFVYSYDKNDNLTESLSYDKNNKFSGKKIYNYDKNDLLIETIGYNASGIANSWRKYEYEYHKQQAAAEVKPQAPVNTQAPIAAAGNNSNAAPVENNTRPTPVSQVSTGEADQHEPAGVETAPARQPEVNFMDALSEQEKSDINFYYAMQETRNQSAGKISQIFEEKKIDANFQNSAGLSLLMMAVYDGDQSMVKFLIEKGASLELKDKRDNDIKFYLNNARKKNAAIAEMINNAAK